MTDHSGQPDSSTAPAMWRYSSLAFGPHGQPAIAYYDSGNGDLGFARRGLFDPGL